MDIALLGGDEPALHPPCPISVTSQQHPVLVPQLLLGGGPHLTHRVPVGHGHIRLLSMSFLSRGEGQRQGPCPSRKLHVVPAGPPAGSAVGQEVSSRRCSPWGISNSGSGCFSPGAGRPQVPGAVWLSGESAKHRCWGLTSEGYK